MEFDHSFSVFLPPERAWDVLLDVDRTALCMPGATVEAIYDDVVTGRMKFRVGPVSLTYHGSARFARRDPAARIMVVEASGEETRGAERASATIRASLQREHSGAGTKVIVHTTLNLTGRPAQFGRGVINEVVVKLLGKFAENLAQLPQEVEAGTRRVVEIGAAPVPGVLQRENMSDRPALVVDPGLSGDERQHLMRKIARVSSPGLIRAVFKRPQLTVEEHAQHIQWYDLDPSCGELLLRAQRAINAALNSGAYSNGIADRVVEESVLRRHEWEIATALRKLTWRRAENLASRQEGEPGPMTAAVLDGQQGALKLVLDSITSRVIALERYAAALEAADAAERDWERALRASRQNDSYLDLIALTAADEQAIAEIANLTEQAEIPRQVYLESLHQASLAAEVLALPTDSQQN